MKRSFPGWTPLVIVYTVCSVSAKPAAADDWIATETRGLAPIHGIYSNRQYGFRVAINPGVSAWRTVSPNPDHGLLMILGDHRTIDVEAEYDAALYGSTPALLEKRLRGLPRGSVIEVAVTSLGNAPAARATVTGQTPSVVVAQWRALPPDNAINYSVVLVTTNEARAKDQQRLAEVLASYRHMPPEH